MEARILLHSGLLGDFKKIALYKTTVSLYRYYTIITNECSSCFKKRSKQKVALFFHSPNKRLYLGEPLPISFLYYSTFPQNIPKV